MEEIRAEADQGLTATTGDDQICSRWRRRAQSGDQICNYRFPRRWLLLLFLQKNGEILDGASQHLHYCKHCTKSDPPCSSSSFGVYSIPLKNSEKLWKVFVASAKGFSIGAVLKGGLALFSILIRLRSRRLPVRPFVDETGDRELGKLLRF